MNSTSLRIYRVGFGVIWFLMHLHFLLDADSFFTDAGVLPLKDALALVGEHRFSILFWFPSNLAVYLTFAAGLVSALAFAFGCRPALAAAIGWLVQISLMNRCEPLVTGDDMYLAAFLFVNIFLFSRRLSRTGQFMFIAQVAILYFFAGHLKSGALWKSGEALWFIYQLKLTSLPLGEYLTRYPGFLKWATWAIPPFEMFAVIALLPWARLNLIRTVWVGIALSMHCVIAITMFHIFLPFLSLIVLVPLVPRLKLKFSIPGAVFAAFVLALNVHSSFRPFLPGAAIKLVEKFRMEQMWDFYGPNPKTTNQWWVIDPPFKKMDADLNWAVYFHELAHPDYVPKLVPVFLRYLCRKGTAENIAMGLYETQVTRDGITPGLLVKSWSHTCTPNPVSSCPGKTTKETIGLKMWFVLDQALADTAAPSENQRKKLFTDSAAQQIRFYQASVKSEVEKEGQQVIFAQDPLELKLEPAQVTEGVLNYESIDAIPHPDVKVEFPYIVHALKRKSSSAKSPHYRVEYSAKLAAYVCEHKKPMTEDQWQGAVPTDPWLAHWMVPASERKAVSWRHSRFSIPEYFDAEYADIPDPYYAWYFWRPVPGLRPGAQVASAIVETRDSQELESWPLNIDVSAWQNQRRLDATVIFGIIDIKSRVLSWKDTFGLIGNEGGANEWRGVMALLSAYLIKDDLDRGSTYAARFLQGLTAILDEKSLHYQLKGDTLHIEGKMVKSGREFNLRFYFGPTDVLTSDPLPRHYALLKDSLAHDDVVFYNGHSGLGLNVETDAIRAGTKPVVFGILSCYSYYYFNPVQDWQRPLQMVLTGSSYTSERGALGALQQIDAKLSGESVAYPLVEPEDFLLLFSEKSKGK